MMVLNRKWWGRRMDNFFVFIRASEMPDVAMQDLTPNFLIKRNEYGDYRENNAKPPPIVTDPFDPLGCD